MEKGRGKPFYLLLYQPVPREKIYHIIHVYLYRQEEDDDDSSSSSSSGEDDFSYHEEDEKKESKSNKNEKAGLQVDEI